MSGNQDPAASAEPALRIAVRRSEDRGHADHGWLVARHTFSFAEYHDRAHMGFRTLRVLNEDRIAPGRGFGTHPHRDMEILTHVLEGSLRHRDSMGNEGVIQPGEFQYMSAGSGVEHSEVNPDPVRPLHLLQIWILPDVRGAPPRYGGKSMAGAAPGRWHLAASGDGRDGSIALRQDADVFLGKLRPGDRLRHELRAGRGAWLQVVEGAIVLAGHALRAGDGASFASSAGGVAWELAASEPATALLFDLA